MLNRNALKTIIGTLLIIILCFTSLTLGAIASDVTGECGDNLLWTFNTENSTLTISGTGAMENYSWEAENTAPWYSFRSDIKTVVIDSGITTIGDYAFFNCCNLTLVSISESVKSIGEQSFRHCEMLENLTIPEGVTEIGFGAFVDCMGLTNITIPDSVTNIGESAFVFCISLTNITLSDNITIVKSNTFALCENLANVTIPYGVTSIDENAFDRCEALSKIEIPNTVTEIGKDCFAGCTEMTEVDYLGCEDDWQSILIGSGNQYLTTAQINFINGNHVKMFGTTSAPYFKIGKQVVLCAETELLHPESDMFYFEYESPETFNVLLPVFTYFESVEKTEETYKTLQQAVWYVLSGNQKQRNFVKIFIGEEYLSLYDELISATVINKNIYLKTYTSNDEKYQTMVGYYIKFQANGVEAILDEECFDERLENLALKISPVVTSVQPGGIYVSDQINREFVGCYDIKIVSANNPDKAAKIKEGYFVTIRIPVPSDYLGRNDITIYHRFSDKSGAEKFTVNPSSEKGEKQLRIVDGYFEFEVSSFSEFEIFVSTNIETTVKIENKTENKTINYRDKLQLTATVDNMPENGNIAWYIGENKVGEGETYTAERAENNFEITVKIVDSDDNVLLDADGEEVSDSQSIIVKAGFWQKLISFFKNLFGISRIVEQAFGFKYIAG